MVPSSLKEEILEQLHDHITSGHLGFNKTYAKLKERFYWTGMYVDTKKWIESCQICASTKTPRISKSGLLVTMDANEPFETVATDILGPLPTSDSGNKYIIVFSDYFTRWVEVFAIKETDAETIAKLFVNEIVCRYGAPKRLLSDRGKNFLSNLVHHICEFLQVKKVNTTAYHPQTDGLVERFNSTLISMLSSYTSSHQTDWDIYIPYLLYAY